MVPFDEEARGWTEALQTVSSSVEADVAGVRSTPVETGSIPTDFLGLPRFRLGGTSTASSKAPEKGVAAVTRSSSLSRLIASTCLVVRRGMLGDMK